MEQVTHTVENGGILLKTSIHARPSEKTPIMLTQHIYWNLDAFQGSDTILAHTLRVAASRVVAVDGDALPTGDFVDVAGTPFDFREPKPIDWRWDETAGLCGGGWSCCASRAASTDLSSLSTRSGCGGYDNCWIYDGPHDETPGVSLWSDLSGIRYV